MRAKSSRFLIYGVILLAILSLPAGLTHQVRGIAMSSMAPLLRNLVDLKLLLQAPFEQWDLTEEGGIVRTQKQEIQRLLLENQLLGNEVLHLKELVEQEFFIFQEMLDDSSMPWVSKTAVSSHQREMLKHFHMSLLNLPARVIFRPLNTWNNTLWIDKGQADNRLLGRTVIAKNSPVVVGLSVVGVVDRVGEHESLVRLVTDANLNASVRAKRGSVYLAKGELAGLAGHKFRKSCTTLKGVGFNSDFADAEGPARDLRTGEVLAKEGSQAALPILWPEDLLITTGLDGVFPAGLHIGVVRKIFPLKEGDFSFELEAEACAGDLSQLSLVFVLPPIQSGQAKL
jgi:hypothetical protein